MLDCCTFLREGSHKIFVSLLRTIAHLKAVLILKDYI